MSKKDLILEALKEAQSIKEVMESTGASRSYVRMLAILTNFKYVKSRRKKKNTLKEKIEERLISHPYDTCKDISIALNCSKEYVYSVSQMLGIPFKRKKKDILERFKKGYSVDFIMGVFKVSKRYAQRLQNLVKKGPRKIQAEKRAEVIKLSNVGWVSKDIAEHLQMSFSTVKNIISRHKNANSK